MRGTWFFENTWQPIEESYAVQIEAEHLAKFQKQKLSEDETDSTKGPPSGTIMYNLYGCETYLAIFFYQSFYYA